MGLRPEGTLAGVRSSLGSHGEPQGPGAMGGFTQRSDVDGFPSYFASLGPVVLRAAR